MSLNSPESRVYPRLREARYIYCWAQGQQELTECVTNNVSAGGICFDVPWNAAVNSSLWIEMAPFVSTGVLHSLYARGRVAWTGQLRQAQGNGMFRMGVEFTRIASPDRARIAQYVANMQKI
jgi:hypothetical protein